MTPGAHGAGATFRGIAFNVSGMPKQKTENSLRFQEKFTKGSSDQCWIWTSQTINSGYGTFWVEGTKRMTAHRYAFQQANGYLPPVVRHSCDVKLCVNPAHLLAGTSKDNMQDMASRHRMGGGNVKLTADQVEQIRRRFISGYHGHGGNRRQLALEYGVNAKHIWRITRGETGDYRITDPKREKCRDH